MRKLILMLAAIFISAYSFAYIRIEVGPDHVNPNAIGWNVQQYEQSITWVDVTGSTLNWFAEAYFGPTNWYNTTPPVDFMIMAAGSIHGYLYNYQICGTNGYYGMPGMKYGIRSNLEISELHIKGVKSHSYGDVFIELTW